MLKAAQLNLQTPAATPVCLAVLGVFRELTTHPSTCEIMGTRWGESPGAADTGYSHNEPRSEHCWVQSDVLQDLRSWGQQTRLRSLTPPLATR